MVININYNKCLGADKCGKCLKICPMGVFTKVPIGKYIYPNPPKEHKIVPYFWDICNNCGACIKICPKDCILL